MKTFISVICCIFFVVACVREREKKGGLLLPDDEALKKVPLAASAGRQFELLNPVDISPNMPPCGDQGWQASCVPWAVGYGLLSYYEKSLSGKSYGPDPAHPDPTMVFSPAFLYNYLKEEEYPQSCGTGVFFWKTFRTIEDVGVCKWLTLPYDIEETACSRAVPDSSLNEAKLYRDYSFERILKTKKNFQYYISHGYPIMLGLFTSKNLEEEGMQAPKDKPYFWNPSRGDKDEYHAMLAVGYDPTNNTVKVMNSWGREWGNDGYASISTDRLFDRTVETYICKRNKRRQNVARLQDVNLKSVNLNMFKFEAANASTILFDNFSMQMSPDDTTDDKLHMTIRDANAMDSFHIAVDSQDVKQFYVGDSLVTFTAENVGNGVFDAIAEVNVVFKNGGLDSNIIEIDSMLNSEYTALMKKKSRTKQEEKLFQALAKRNQNAVEVNYTSFSYKSMNIGVPIAITVVLLVAMIFVILSKRLKK